MRVIGSLDKSVIVIDRNGNCHKRQMKIVFALRKRLPWFVLEGAVALVEYSRMKHSKSKNEVRNGKNNRK